MKTIKSLIKHLESLQTNKEVIQYCKDNLKMIGTGSTRIVFAFNDKYAIKVAQNDVGVKQNETEVRAWLYLDYDAPNYKQYFAKVHVNLCQRNNVFIVMDRLQKASQGVNKHLEACTYIKINKPAPDALQGRPVRFANALHSVDLNLDLITVADIRKGNIGVDSKGLIKVLDYGLSESVWRHHYKNNIKAVRKFKEVPL